MGDWALPELGLAAAVFLQIGFVISSGAIIWHTVLAMPLTPCSPQPATTPSPAQMVAALAVQIPGGSKNTTDLKIENFTDDSVDLLRVSDTLRQSLRH